MHIFVTTISNVCTGHIYNSRAFSGTTWQNWGTGVKVPKVLKEKRKRNPKHQVRFNSIALTSDSGGRRELDKKDVCSVSCWLDNDGLLLVVVENGTGLRGLLYCLWSANDVERSCVPQLQGSKRDKAVGFSYFELVSCMLCTLFTSGFGCLWPFSGSTPSQYWRTFPQLFITSQSKKSLT